MIFNTLYSNQFKKLAHNVLGNWRFGQVIGQCVALTPAQTVAEKNRAEGVSPNTVFRSPSRLLAAKQLPFVMRRWGVRQFLFYTKNQIVLLSHTPNCGSITILTDLGSKQFTYDSV